MTEFNVERDITKINSFFNLKNKSKCANEVIQNNISLFFPKDVSNQFLAKIFQNNIIRNKIADFVRENFVGSDKCCTGQIPVKKSSSFSDHSQDGDVNPYMEIDEKIHKIFEKYRKSNFPMDKLTENFKNSKFQYPYSLEQLSYVGTKIISKVEKISKKLLK